MRLRTTVRLGLLGLLLVGVAAAASSRPDRRDPARLVVVTPALDADAAQLVALGVAEGLVRADVRFGPVEPELAVAWEDRGGGRWTFRLRPGVTFHDGRPLSAPAVVASLTEGWARGESAWLGRLLSARALSEELVEVRCSSPSCPVPQYLARSPVLAPGAWDATGRLIARIGTGPFAVERWATDEAVTLRANPRWWGGAPTTTGIDVRVVKDPASRVLMLEAGQADWIQRVPRRDARRLELAGYQVPASTFLYNVYLVFRAGAGVVAEREVRRAIALALDRARLRRVAFEDLALPASGVFPPGHPLHDGDDAAARRDLAEAERLLDAAGWRRPSPGAERERGGVTLTLPLLTVADTYRPAWGTAAELLRQDLAAIGMRVELEPLERGAWASRVNQGAFVATLRGRVPGWWADAYGVLRTDFRSDGVNNPGRFQSPTFDRLLDEAWAASDVPARHAALRAALDVLRDELPIVPLCHDLGRELYVVADGVASADDPVSRGRAFPGPRAHR